MAIWQLVVLAWAVGVPLAVTAYVFAYPAYLHRRGGDDAAPLASSAQPSAPRRVAGGLHRTS
jgi:hypothetical protein